jgi:hypothetical protein
VTAVAVAERAADQQQTGDGERVGVEDPLQLARPSTEVLGEGRQRGVDDRVVDDDEEDAQAQHDERPPASVAGLGGGLGGKHLVLQ